MFSDFVVVALVFSLKYSSKNILENPILLKFSVELFPSWFKISLLIIADAVVI